MDWQDATCYLNGEWQPLASAGISVLDRGFIFGDGVYEVIPVDTVEPGLRAPFRAREHFARLERSLAAVRIADPLAMDEWLGLLAALIERHPWPRQTVYLQVTRGAAKRDHAFPAGVAPTVFAVSSPWPPIPAENLERGVACVTHADERWLHCDVKSISLAGNVLMKQHAVDHGAFETILFRDGLLTEASSANVFAVRRGTIAVPSKSNLILPGITYDAVLDIALARGIEVEVRPVDESEVRTADELWLSSSGREILPVTRLDGEPIGDGAPGPLFRRMHGWFQQAKREDALRWKSMLHSLRLAA
jgi:D-alanine transaminase